MNTQFDVLIIGGGAAGLTLALSLPHHYQVGVLSKTSIKEGNTYYAQGGVAAVIDQEDDIQQHIDDTLVAGAGLCDPSAVAITVENGPDAIAWLVNQGVEFSKEQDGSRFHLTQEGGHSHRRILHATDATGYAIANALVQQTRERANIHIIENHIAIDLITTQKLNPQSMDNRTVGVYALSTASHQVISLQASHIALATGGASKAYVFTTNPDVTTGDGIAMAWRAGCRVANMEFNQFHPTCLFHPDARNFLISEAVRGEGGHLKLPSGERFMARFDDRLELAPRDIVARAIDHEMKRLGLQYVLLDISHRPANFIQSHFPTIYEKCLSLGIDITQEPIPVVPAAHYTCGGVVVDSNGQTDLPGLYAIGETACTGLHGANRMASNSLLECIVYARRCAETIAAAPRCTFEQPLPQWDDSQVTDADEAIVIHHNWHELRQCMWNYVGIVRSNKRLQRANSRIELLSREIAEFYGHHTVTPDLIELRNLTLVADLIVKSALQRQESRGLHYSLDYPTLAPEAVDTVLEPPSSQKQL